MGKQRYLLFFSVFALLSSSGARGSLLNGTAATVGSVLITVQDAYFYRALQRMVASENDLTRLETGADFRRTVQKVVFENMVVAELKSLEYEVASLGEAEKILAAAKAKVGEANYRSMLTQFGRTEKQAEETLFRSLRVERFLQRKVETLSPIITDSELERYYRQNQSVLKGDFETLKPKLMTTLKKERMQKGLEEWVRFLKEKYGVLNLLEG